MNNTLQMLKIDLGISTDKIDQFLTGLIIAARKFIQREGITLDGSPEDEAIVEMYAAHLYRKRREAETAMPRMLRFELNNRLMSEKARDGAWNAPQY